MPKVNKQKLGRLPAHYTASYMLDPVHPITITLIGVGGTGSQFLSQLGRIHISLQKLGHPGFKVSVYDPDIVTEANLGRQLFAESDIERNKAEVLVTRVNRFFGTKWESFPVVFSRDKCKISNIMVTAVDNVATREDVSKIKRKNYRAGWAYDTPGYWMDFGNSKNSGQIVIGTFDDITQPAKTPLSRKKLPTILELFPNLKKFEKKDDTPSCSLAEALDKQDLFINSTLAQLGGNILWKMFRDLKLEYHGCYLNLQNLTMNPIPVR